MTKNKTLWWWSNRSKTFRFIILTAFYLKFYILLLPAKCIYDQKCLEKKFSRSQTGTVNLHRKILIERKESSKTGNTKTPEHLFKWFRGIIWDSVGSNTRKHAGNVTAALGHVTFRGLSFALKCVVLKVTNSSINVRHSLTVYVKLKRLPRWVL